IDVPIYAIHGENDELFPLSDVEDWVQASVDTGSDITLEVAPGLTHTEPCEYASYLQNAASWLENHVWN
ncbi:MAG TPA: dienelactone hydrolase family protein, partial [Mangrovimonas sp.]|nr:dienelactone hydrolase family protein [Mangrovimonas sp.]